MTPYVNIAWVKIGSGKDSLLPDDTKPSLEPMLTYYSSVGGDWEFSKVVATFSRVGGSLKSFYGHHRGCLNNPIISNLGLCAVCWAHFMCHYELWPTSVGHPFSFLNTCSSWGLTGGKHYQKEVFRFVLQNFTIPAYFPYILFYSCLFSLLFFWLACYCSMWFYFSSGNKHTYIYFVTDFHFRAVIPSLWICWRTQILSLCEVAKLELALATFPQPKMQQRWILSGTLYLPILWNSTGMFFKLCF